LLLYNDVCFIWFIGGSSVGSFHFSVYSWWVQGNEESVIAMDYSSLVSRCHRRSIGLWISGLIIPFHLSFASLGFHHKLLL
jgi:hypothetical protein